MEDKHNETVSGSMEAAIADESSQESASYCCWINRYFHCANNTTVNSSLHFPELLEDRGGLLLCCSIFCFHNFVLYSSKYFQENENSQQKQAERFEIF